MITPFENDYAIEFIKNIADNLAGAVLLTNEMLLSCIFNEYHKAEENFMHKQLKKDSYSDEEIEDILNDDSVDSETGYEAWTSACLYDAIMNNTDYSRYCTSYEEVYNKAVEMLKKDLFRKKFLSKKPVHNISEILQNTVEALDYVLGINNDSEIADKMRSRGIFEEWRSEIIDLQNRLSKHTEYI